MGGRRGRLEVPLPNPASALGDPIMPDPRPGPGGAPRLPRSGDVLKLTRSASVQFATPIAFRVIRRHERETYEGWVWLDGYELDSVGDAVARRDVFVQIAGLRWMSDKPATPSAARPVPPGVRNMRAAASPLQVGMSPGRVSTNVK